MDYFQPIVLRRSAGCRVCLCPTLDVLPNLPGLRGSNFHEGNVPVSQAQACITMCLLLCFYFMLLCAVFFAKTNIG